MHKLFFQIKFVPVSVLILFVFSPQLTAQEFRIYDVNTDEYPIISAKYILTNHLQKKVIDLTKEEISITENNQEREIIYLKNPQIKAMPLSILLIFDISGSMKNNRMEIAKEAARGLISEVDLSISEIAISTFNYNAFLNCDFTHDSIRLISAVDALEPIGGTSYDDAFLSDLTGGIEIAKQGMFKKIIIFMTDGLGEADADTIINLAKKSDITVFTTTIELDMPPVLRDISKETDGYFFPQVNNPKTSKTIYSKLYRDIVATEYGIMKWAAADDCEDIHNVDINTRGLSTGTSFELPVDSIEGLVVLPSSLFVRSQGKDSMATKYIRIASPHKPVSIANIISTDSDKVKVDVPEFPLVLRPGENYQLKVDYPVKGNSEGKYQVKIYTENCLQRNSIDIHYGVPGKIEVIKPAGGDKYGAGVDTIIEWTGISKNQPVALYYKYGTRTWQKIAETSGLKYRWETPFDTSGFYQIMAKPADATDFDKKYEIPGQIRDVRIMDVSNDGTLFITRDAVGMVNVWQNGSLRPVKTFWDAGSRFIYFSKDDLYVLIYNNNSITVKNIFTDSQKPPVYRENYKIFAANPTLYGDEYLLPAGVMPGSQEVAEFTDMLTSDLLFEIKHDKNPPLYAAKCANAPYVLFMNQDYSLNIHNLKRGKTKRLTRNGQVVTKAYISPNGKYVYSEESDRKRIIETNRGRPVINIDDNFYVRFSPDGNKLLTMDSKRDLILWDLDDRIELRQFPQARYFNFSHNGDMFYVVHDNTVTLYDVNKRFVTHKIVCLDIEDISISRDGSEILVTSNGKAEIYDCATGGLKLTIENQSSPVSKAVYADNSKIITINQDKSISVWEPSLSPESGVSGIFSIVSPLPDVTPQYNIGTEIVSQTKEVVLDDFVTNNSEFPIRILRYEWDAYPGEYGLVSNPPPFTLQPGESKDVEIRFSPSDTIMFPTSISVVTPGGDVQSNIVGTGIDKKYKLPDKIVDFGKIEWNTRRDTTVPLIKNISDDIIVVENVKNSGPDTEQFSIVSNIKNENLNPGDVLNARLRYSALQRGRTSGSLKITVDEQEVSVQLFGEGLGPKGVYVKGTTIDQDSNAIQSNVICAEIDTEKQLYNQLSDTLQGFNFTLYTEGSFILYAEKEGYISASENIDIAYPFQKDTVDATIMLSRIEQGSLFRLNGVFFEFAKADLILSSKTDLDRVLYLLQANNEINIEVRGHTDEIGTEESNLELSKNRANAVKNYLVENGISAERISIQYFGEAEPVASNETEEGRQLNRRVEFLIKE